MNIDSTLHQNNLKLLLRLVIDGNVLTALEGKTLTRWSQRIMRDWIDLCPTDEDKITFWKSIILLEKFMEDIGEGASGSGNMSHIVYNTIEKLGLDSEYLINWVLRNKSTNKYTPFGNCALSAVQNYDGYLQYFQEEKQQKAQKMRDVENQAELKKQKKLKKAQAHKERVEKFS